MTKTTIQSTSEKALSPVLIHDPLTTAGDYAHLLIGKQYHHMLQQEQGVLADDDPEYLHQMRVDSRRLSKALRVFRDVVKLPKGAREPRVRALTKALGRLRDLDVQIAAIRTETNWETLRHQYLDPDFRHRLHQMILIPSTQS